MVDGRPPLVRMTGITKRYPGVLALDGVDLDLCAGEVHALTGENGSGKSTLAKILYGATGADHGTIEIDGEQVTIGSPSRALELGIVAISQELTLAPSLSVAENILMGRLPVSRLGTIAWREAVALAGEALDRLGVRVDPRKRVADLPIELRQEVEIARAMSVKSRVLILDEATSSLSQGGVQSLMRMVGQLAETGVAVLMITHRMPEIYESASRATVLRDGRRVAELPIPAAGENELIRAMVGRELGDLFRKRKLDVGEPVLEVSELATLHGSVGPASFTVRSGEIVGVAGLVGSARQSWAWR